MAKVEIVNVETDDYGIKATTGDAMADGLPRWTFVLRRDGCLHVRCGSTDPAEDMHVCNPAELHRLLGEVIAKAREAGGFELDED